jgi:4-hydroxy-2-oxoglutarate aldolase
MNLSGVFCPVVTPFTHEDAIHTAKVLHNVSRLNQVALAGYVVGSTTGEGEMLSFEERVRMLELVAQVTAPQKLKIAAVVEPSVVHSARYIAKAAELGYQAALLEATDDFYARCVADRSPIPVLANVANHPNIIATPIQAPALANAAPYVYVTIFEAERQREPEAAADWRLRIAPAEAAIAKHGIPAIKCVMELFGYYGGIPRLPRVPLASAQRNEIVPLFSELRS